jgi:sulfur-oxidizing protein SoxY
MMQTRRELLKQGAIVAGLLAGTGLFPQWRRPAFNKGAFDAKTWPICSRPWAPAAPGRKQGRHHHRRPTSPRTAPSSRWAWPRRLPGVKQLLLLVEKNPSPWPRCSTSPTVDANFSTRVKMGQSSDVYAVAVTEDGKVFFAKKEVKVTLGGCGG